MEKNIQRMRCEVGEIYGTQFFQSPDEILRRPGAVWRVMISWKFMTSWKEIKDDGNEHVDRREEKAKENNACVNRHACHSECLWNTLITDGERQKAKEYACVQDRGKYHFCDMVKFEVAHLMGKDSDNFLIREFFQQGVIEDDFSKVAKACEKCI